MRYMFDGNTVLEQRYEPRYKARLAIFYGSEQHKLLRDYSINVSTGGVFIETERPMPVDTALHVEFMLPVHDAPIYCRTKVAWTNEPGKKESKYLPTGMGLQFLDLSLETIHSIRVFIDEGGLEPAW